MMLISNLLASPNMTGDSSSWALGNETRLMRTLITLLLFSGLLQQVLLLEAFRSLSEIAMLARCDQRGPIDLAQEIIILLVTFDTSISALVSKLFSLEVLIVEIQLKICY